MTPSPVITSTRPGQVRDTIDTLLREAGRVVSAKEISNAVRENLSSEVPASTIRSCLNLHVDDLWVRVSQGWYASSHLPEALRVAPRRSKVEPMTAQVSISTAVLILQDCKEGLLRLADNSLDAVITDPPYCLASLGADWDIDGAKKTTKNSTISHLAGGMAFNSDQSRELQELIQAVAIAAYSKLKPGGWFLAFSAPRLAHRMAVGIEDAGYEIRDQWGWLYRQNLPKGMSVKRFLPRLDLTGYSPEDRKQLEDELEIWKTPQVKCVIEPVIVAQKPREGTFIENWEKHHVGLLNFDIRVGEGSVSAPANLFVAPDGEDGDLPLSGIIEVAKSKREYRDRKGVKQVIEHLSPKPLAMMEHLIRLTVPEGGVVCDPFNGSGSTGLAALACGRNYIGIEREPSYMKLTQDRFRSEFQDERLTFVETSRRSKVWSTNKEFVSEVLPSY